ncbi:hypothetical protein A2997_01665 [Candidatus Nomurabacteria bacterium RIFCSPLOWO2_01_FULL_36_10b]|uniref:Type 4 fimbrial biogenesis protein PilX N-terminal domain-containing protein n=1 Tax=Candidatus Nomurabacteria bacterium RIFCSPLOWO2_01_FULL_36_10b TaxID=1801766 RepID=A0A1F6WNF6_9BACT|nr:MAG: hypothetical protein A2997_01665 [Candidatus Nomurabacteria bacterium RIFCSPLOWO2_01_FULL_36_10b]
MNKKLQLQSGFSLLLAVMFLSAIGLIVALTLSLNSQSTLLSYHARDDVWRARWLATACAEYALQQISMSTTYTGNSSLTFDSGSCTYVVDNSTPAQRHVQTTGVSDNSFIEFSIDVSQISPRIVIDTWDVVAN